VKLPNRDTRVTDPAHTEHGGYMHPGLVVAIEQMATAASTLRDQIASDRGVKLAGARWIPIGQSAMTSSSLRRVLASATTEWLGYLLTETTGTGPLVVAIGDGDNSGDDQVGELVVPAGEMIIARWRAGVALARGLVLTPVSGAGSITGSLFAANALAR
jgi:hypothetical protein